MTQLGELRDAYGRFLDAGIKVYAVSYDDVDALAAFAEANAIPYPLLSDRDSAVIRRYGILNTLIEPHEAPFYGIPFPGTYLVDEDGVVVEKFFPRHLALRESADTVLDSALGSILAGGDAPRSAGGEDGIRVTAWFHGGGGTIKSGIVRRVVVRFELPEGLHIYGEPVPEGMVATTVEVRGPRGLVAEAPIRPPTTPLRLDALGVELQTWSGTVDIAVPVWANSHLIDLYARDADRTVELAVTVRYQACSDGACLLPRTETFELEVPVAPLDVPNIPALELEGQRTTTMDSMKHIVKLLERFERSE